MRARGGAPREAGCCARSARGQEGDGALGKGTAGPWRNATGCHGTTIRPKSSRGPAPGRGPGSTVAQLKQDITSGATGDKLAAFDPGMADIGTDDEAAGTPMTPEMIEFARKAERMKDPPSGDPGKRANAEVGPRLFVALFGAMALGVAAALIGFR